MKTVSVDMAAIQKVQDLIRVVGEGQLVIEWLCDALKGRLDRATIAHTIFEITDRCYECEGQDPRCPACGINQARFYDTEKRIERYRLVVTEASEILDDIFRKGEREVC